MTDVPDRLNAALADRYTIERELGAGGMATVWLAHDLKHDRKVAVKVLKPELAAVVGAERFLAEIRTTANLQHPHVLPLFDSGAVEGFLYFVMPYVEGESLRQRLDRERQLPVEEAVQIATEVADALAHAHSHGVIHRDIKPANILLRDGRAQVADFGIALAVQQAGGARLTETGLSVGTPHYMSPEQASGDRELDGRSDVYSLGCVLYEMLAGEPPHTGPTAQAILAKILTDEPRPVSQLRRLTPSNVSTALEVALRKLPADRVPTARDFAAALDPRNGAKGTRPLRRNGSTSLWRNLAATLGACAAIATGLAAWSWFGARRDVGVRHVRYLPIELRDPPRAFFAWGPGVNLSPTGNRLAYMGAGRWWWLLDLTERSGPEPLGIYGNNVAFSPSGDSLAHTTSAWLQQIYIVDLASGRSTFLTDSAQGQLNWKPDGWIYYKDQLNGIRRVRVADGYHETLVRPGPDDHWHAVNPAPLPNGKGLLYTRVPRQPRTPARSEIIALDFESGEAKVLDTGLEAEVTASGHLLVTRVDGSLHASQFDQENMEVIGPSVPVLEEMETRELWEVGGSYNIDDEGSLLYVQRRQFQEDTVLFVNRDGQILRTLPTWGGVLYDPVENLDYSEKDGLWAVAVHRGLTAPNIFVRSPSAIEPRRLSFGEVLDVYPRFIPGTQELAFVSPREGNNWDLYRVPFYGGKPPDLLLDRPGDVRFPRFTSDGRWVVFCEASHTGARDVMAHRLGADSATVPLVATDAEECYPDVSPDLRWLAYESNESGTVQVYVRPFAEGATTFWQISDDGGTTPRWSSTGRELFFVNTRNELVSVPVFGSGSFSFGSPRVVFAMGQRTTWTGVTADDDQEFVLVRVHGEAPGQVVLVRNFLELLRRSVGE